MQTPHFYQNKSHLVRVCMAVTN